MKDLLDNLLTFDLIFQVEHSARPSLDTEVNGLLETRQHVAALVFDVLLNGCEVLPIIIMELETRDLFQPNVDVFYHPPSADF